MFLSVFSSSSEFRYLEGVCARWELLFCSNMLLKTSHIYSQTIYIEMYTYSMAVPSLFIWFRLDGYLLCYIHLRSSFHIDTSDRDLGTKQPHRAK